MDNKPRNQRRNPSTKRSLSRRAMLRNCAAGLTLGFLYFEGKGIQLAAADVQQTWTEPVYPGFGGSCPRFGVFNDHEFATLEAIAEQIVPTDDDPGAQSLCCASLVEALAAGDPDTAALHKEGFIALDQSSNIRYGQQFIDLTFAQQTELLIELEAGQAPGSAWNSPFFIDYICSQGQPYPSRVRRMMRHLHKHVPDHRYCYHAPTSMVSTTAQQAVFGLWRTQCKLGFVLNFPETGVRNPDGTPIFSDSAHLISDPDDDSTPTGWGIVEFHEITYDVEKLMWEWQSGLRVIGFDGVPILDVNNPLSMQERMTARDTLYALAAQGLA